MGIYWQAKRAELCTLSMYRYAIHADWNSTSAVKAQLEFCVSKFHSPSVLCLLGTLRTGVISVLCEFSVADT